MISIKHFLEQGSGNSPGLEQEVVEALRQVGRLLVNGIAKHTVRGREVDFSVLRRELQALAQQIDEPDSAQALLSSSSDTTEAMETYCGQTTKYFHDQKDQMQAMVIMLSETVADVSGQSDTSVVRLQTIERELELASGLNDLRAIRVSLESCLASLREANAQQRSKSVATVQQLQNHIDRVQKGTSVVAKHVPFSRAEIDLISALREGPGKSLLSSYVGGFKLKRAEHIAERFGEDAAREMVAALGALLKAVLGPHDRLLRREGASFVMFINTTAPVGEIRAQLSETVAKIGTKAIEVGRKAALLAIGVDWILFPQVSTLEAVIGQVDRFLAGAGPEKSAATTRR